MDKLEEIINKSITDMEGKFHPFYIDGYGDGFSAAMELQLPVLFMRWTKNLNGLVKDNVKRYTDKELYNYWIKNIYQPE